MSRGRNANWPSHIPLRGWLDVGWRIWLKMADHNIGLIAAGIGFYGLLSVFPGITALVALAGVFMAETDVQGAVDPIMTMVPADGRALIADQLSEVNSTKQGALGLAATITLLIAFYSASRAVDSLVRGLNVIYEETERRSFLMLKLRVFVLTLAVLLGLLLAIALVAALPVVLAFFGEETAATLALYLRWPLLFVFGIFGIAALYRHGPDRAAAKWRWITPGAMLACLLWVISSYGFSLYVQNFGTYNETFGALGGVIVLLTWMWLSAFVVLLGAQLDAEMEAQTARDSTIGKPKPMGERGAVKADKLGEARGNAGG